MLIWLMVCLALVLPRALSETQITKRQQEIIKELDRDYKEAANALYKNFGMLQSMIEQNSFGTSMPPPVLPGKPKSLMDTLSAATTGKTMPDAKRASQRATKRSIWDPLISFLNLFFDV